MMTFAQHADPTQGFNAVPRWMLRRPEYKAFSAAHRAVLLTLFFLVRRVPATSTHYGVELERGQWAGTWDYLARASGATREQARRATRKASKLGMIAQATRRSQVDGRTADYLLFTWLDFDSYDIANNDAHRPAHTPAHIPAHSVRDTPAHTKNTEVKDTGVQDTALEDTDEDPVEESDPATPGARHGEGDAPAGGRSAGEEGRTTSTSTGEGPSPPEPDLGNGEADLRPSRRTPGDRSSQQVVQQLAGTLCDAIAKAEDAAGLQRTPRNMGQASGVVAGLLCGTAKHAPIAVEAITRRINVVYDNWLAIDRNNRSWMEDPPQPNSRGILFNPKIIELVERIERGESLTPRGGNRSPRIHHPRSEERIEDGHLYHIGG